jgi:hypothetical protein
MRAWLRSLRGLLAAAAVAGTGHRLPPPRDERDRP